MVWSCVPFSLSLTPLCCVSKFNKTMVLWVPELTQNRTKMRVHICKSLPTMGWCFNAKISSLVFNFFRAFFLQFLLPLCLVLNTWEANCLCLEWQNSLIFPSNSLLSLLIIELWLPFLRCLNTYPIILLCSVLNWELYSQLCKIFFLNRKSVSCLCSFFSIFSILKYHFNETHSVVRILITFLP